MLLALFLPAALTLQKPLVGAIFLLLSALATFFFLGLANLLRSWAGAGDFTQTHLLVLSLWLVPLLGLALQKNPLALLCTIPFLYSLMPHLPSRAAPFGNAFIAAAGIHGVLVLQAMDKPRFALMAMLAVAGLIFWAAEPLETRRLLRILSGVLAVVLGLLPFLPPPEPESTKPALAATALVRPHGGGDPSEQSALQGIFLRPEAEEKDYQLPPPPVLRVERFASIPEQPLEIPFSGVYWIFQPPLTAPPEKSPEEVGTPADFRFRSEDSTPVRLEARQSLLKPFPTQRIQAIGVTLLSKDRFPDTLSLQVFATSSQDRRIRINLGTERVGFMPEWNAVPQTLNFKMPPQPLLSEFDGLILRFVLEPPRLQIVPRLSVQKFVIHPR